MCLILSGRLYLFVYLLTYSLTYLHTCAIEVAKELEEYFTSRALSNHEMGSPVKLLRQ